MEKAGATVLGPFGSTCVAANVDVAGPIAAAIVDINLGRGPAFDFAKLQERGTPFVFVTEYDAAVIPSDLASLPRIEKPVRERELIAAVSQIVTVNA